MPRAVGAEHHDPVAAADLEAQIVEQQLFAVGLAQSLHAAEDVLDVQAAVDLGHDLVDGTGRAGLLDLGQLVTQPATGRLGRLPAVGDPFGFKGQEFRFVHKLLLEGFEAELFLHDVFAEVARVFVQVEVLHLDDPGDDGIEELPVVRDDDRGALEVPEPAFEPFDAGNVQEVGGLVEQQDVGSFEEDLGQGCPVAPAAGQLVDRAGAVRLIEAQGREDSVDAPRVVPAVEPFHVLEQLRLAADEPVEFGVRGIGGDGRVNGGQFGFDRLDLRKQRVEHFQNRGFTVEFGELGEVAHLRAQFQGHGAGVRCHLVQDQLEDGGLAGAVLADQAHPVPGLEPEEGFPENLGVVEAHADVVQPDQAHWYFSLNLGSGTAVAPRGAWH